MQAYRDFTTDAVNFPLAETQKFVNQLHSDGMKFVPIIDPGIMVYSGYPAYENGKFLKIFSLNFILGLKQDIFVKDISGSNYLGQVWPGPTYFPDFFHPNIEVFVFQFLNSNIHRIIGPLNFRISSMTSQLMVSGSI